MYMTLPNLLQAEVLSYTITLIVLHCSTYVLAVARIDGYMTNTDSLL